MKEFRHPAPEGGAVDPKREVFGFGAVNPHPRPWIEDCLKAGGVARLGSARLRHVADGLAWAPDGKTLASVGPDGRVRVWEADDGKETRALRAPNSLALYSVAYLPDGKRLAAMGADGAVHVGDATTGLEVRTLAWGPLVGAVRAGARLAAGPDGTVAAVGGELAQREGPA